MIPLLLGVQPSQNTAQPTNAGSGNQGGTFEGLLASMVPAEPDPAQALDETATEPDTEEKLPAGTGGEGFGELQLQERLVTLGTSILPVAAAAPAPVGTVATDGPQAPGSLASTPEVEASVPVDPLVAASVSGVAADAGAADGTNPGVTLLASAAPQGTLTDAGEKAQPVAEENETPATASVDGARAEARGPAVEPEARPVGTAPESKPSPSGPTPGFQVPVHPDASRIPRPETLAGVGAVSGGRTLAVESVVSREPQAPPINRQLAGPIASLAAGPHGERTVSVNIAPEALGPVTVKAHLGHEGMRVELTAPTEAGREALRAMLPELRRDLAATGAGTVSIGTATATATDAGTGAGAFSGGGQASMANDHRFGGGSPASAAPGRQQGEEATRLPDHESLPSAHASSHLDVMA